VEELDVNGTENKIGRVWLNRPQKRNALSAEALQDIVDAFSFLQTQFQIPVVILAGRGKSFCAGADLQNPPTQVSEVLNGRQKRHAMHLGRRAIKAIENCEAITIARVHGHAIGGGFGIMQACDMRCCTRTTKLSVPEVNLGIPLTWGLTARMIRDVGRAKAMELITLCEDLPPTTAETLGLINRVAESDAEAEAVTLQWAEKLAQQQETALHMVKTQFRALAHSIDLGDVTESDNDLLLLAPALRSKL